MKASVVFGCLGAAALGLLLTAGAASWFYHITVDSPALEQHLLLPEEAVVGIEFDMTVAVRNPHDTDVVLDSIDIDDAFLAGFQVLATTPESIEDYPIPDFDQRSWTFGIAVEAGATLDVVYRLRPLDTGRFVGQVDVCNPAQNYLSRTADIVVRAPEDPA